MNGVVFTKFLAMVEEQFGLEVVDTIIETSNLTSEGIYTSVGTYDFNEMASLIDSLSKTIDTDAKILLQGLGSYLFTDLVKVHPEVIENFTDPIYLLSHAENCIRADVQKLYPEAKLPIIKVLENTDASISVIYISSTASFHLAHGLIAGCFKHYNRSFTVAHEMLNVDGTEVRFDIVQNG